MFVLILIEPGKESALPKDTVLRFEHPMVLIGEDEQFGGYAFHACCIEGAHALGIVDAVVFLTVDAEDRCIPVIDKLMR